MSVALLLLLLKLFQFKPGNPLVTPSKLQLQDLQTQLNDLHTKFKTWVTNVKKNKLKRNCCVAGAAAAGRSSGAQRWIRSIFRSCVRWGQSQIFMFLLIFSFYKPDTNFPNNLYKFMPRIVLWPWGWRTAPMRSWRRKWLRCSMRRWSWAGSSSSQVKRLVSKMLRGRTFPSPTTQASSPPILTSVSFLDCSIW